MSDTESQELKQKIIEAIEANTRAINALTDYLMTEQQIELIEHDDAPEESDCYLDGSKI